MRSLKLTIAYDGTSYAGWQRQAALTPATLPGDPPPLPRQLNVSIQQLVEDACAPLAGGVAPGVAGAGRTDAGVHAIAQVASVSFETSLDTDTICRALNFRLPDEVRVMRVDDAPPKFHARFDALGKRYRYRLFVAPVVSPFQRWFVWHAPDARDVDAMTRAAALLVGRHDFASFQSAGTEVADTIRTIRRADVQRSGDEIVLDIEGDGFLRHMVRAIAGTLVDVGAGRRSAESMADVLRARQRLAAGATAPACGLTLVEVLYC